MFQYLFLLALPALIAGQSVDDFFNLLDKNGDHKPYDANNDGVINPHEFISYIEAQDQSGTQHHFSGVDRQMFDFLDQNNDKHLDSADYTILFNNVDANGDDSLNHHEFTDYFGPSFSNVVGR